MEIQSKDELLGQISLAVEQVQKQFVQGENVIKDCQETFFLCQCVNNILHHGLKEGLISWAVEPTIWPLLEKITCTKDLEEIKMLRLKTDKEKCNVWIRMAVNENLLGSYIATINQDHSLLSNHYYEYAFLCDPVMTETVKSLLNYGIANFDFQILITENNLSTQRDLLRKQGCHISYDAFEKTKENGYDSPKTQAGLAFPQESSSRKIRKKKKPAKTVVIEDQDDYLDETDGTEVENSNIVEDISEKDKNFMRVHENDKLLQNSDDAEHSKTDKWSFRTIDQSTVSTLTDVRTEGLDMRGFSSNDHATNTANDNKANRADVDQFDASEESSKNRTVFASNQLEQYLSLNQSQNSQTEKRDNELDSLGRMIERPSSRQEFRTNDFHLDETEPQNITDAGNNVTASKDSATHVSDVESSVETKHSSTQSRTDKASASKGDAGFTNFRESCRYSDSGENSDLQNSEKEKAGVARFYIGPNSIHEEFPETPSTAEDVNSPSSSKSQTRHTRRDYPERHSAKDEFPETRTCTDKNFSKSEKSDTGLIRETIGKSKEQGDDELSEISSSGQSYDYRVRKIENPEFVPSSYGSSSALSDITDDDRDLNFVPGIHRLSSKSFSSSFERRSTADSSVSFDENGLPLFESTHYESSSSRPSSIDDGSSRFADISNDWDMFEDLINVDEEHFSRPDNFAGLSTSEELEMAIEHYKKMIKIRQEKSQQRDDLVNKLVKLRLRLQQEKDGPPVENPQFRKILSHQFSKTESSAGTKYFCDQCGKNIWTMWHSLFSCKECGYHSHRKCLEHIQRPCPNKNLSSASYILDICPDTGLDAQQYRCAECRKEIAFSKEDVAKARICDYTGQYFCNNCHWNDQVIIPARVLRNWDFSEYKVCRRTKQLLELMKTRPILNIQKLNPLLYRYVEELREVGRFREDILIMKKYFLTCREAMDSKLLIQLQKRQHFVDSAHMYSFQDLIDVNNDVLLPEISKVHALFLAHIKADCEICRARGFICEVCQDSSDVIFAFDPHTVKCTKCSAVFHKICFKPDVCPKCERKKKVASEKT